MKVKAKGALPQAKKKAHAVSGHKQEMQEPIAPADKADGQVVGAMIRPIIPNSLQWQAVRDWFAPELFPTREEQAQGSVRLCLEMQKGGGRCQATPESAALVSFINEAFAARPGALQTGAGSRLFIQKTNEGELQMWVVAEV